MTRHPGSTLRWWHWLLPTAIALTAVAWAAHRADIAPALVFTVWASACAWLSGFLYAETADREKDHR